MTTENGLFNSNDPELDDNYEIPGAAGTDDLLESLVGEGKKYKSAADLAFAKLNADAHIKRIQEENKALREAAKTKADLESLLSQFKQPNAPTEASNPTNDGGGELGALSPEDLVAKVLSTLEERTKKSKEQENMEIVKQTVTSALGPSWQSELKARLAETDLTEAQADTLARNNPKTFFRILGIDQNTKAPSPSLFNAAPASKVNTASVTNLGSPERTKSYYDKIKKQMGTQKFFSNTTLQTQMHNDALRLQDKFFDT